LVQKTLFEKEGGIARSAMTGDLWETNFELEFVSPKTQINMTYAKPTFCFEPQNFFVKAVLRKSSHLKSNHD